MLIQEAIDEFLEALRADGCAEKTKQWYEQKLNELARHLSAPVEEVSRRDLRRYVAHLRSPERGLSPETVAGHVRAIKRFFGWLLEEECIEKDPSTAIKHKKEGEKVPKAIKRKTALALLKVADHPRDEALLYFLAQTACRADEARTLSCDNLDLQARNALVTGKGAKDRFVFLKPEAWKSMRAWMEMHPGGEYVFCNLESGEALSCWGLRQIVLRLKEKAGLDSERCNLHSFRHFFAREYLMDGGDMASLQDLMGHEDMSTTKRAYILFTQRDLQEKHARHAPSFGDDDGGKVA